MLEFLEQVNDIYLHLHNTDCFKSSFTVINQGNNSEYAAKLISYDSSSSEDKSRYSYYFVTSLRSILLNFSCFLISGINRNNP